MNSLSSSTLLILSNFEYQTLNLSINYENLLHINLKILDCDTIEQIKTKLNYYLNSNEEIDLFISSKTNSYFCSHQIPMIKQYLINSTILFQKKISSTRSQNNLYHLIMENQLIEDEKWIENQLKENKNWEEILRSFIKKFKKV